mgnify:FL=1
MRFVLAAIVLGAVACGDVANPDPVPPGAPLTAQQVERAIADLVPSDAVAVVRVRSPSHLARVGEVARGLGLPLPSLDLSDVAREARLPLDAIDPELPVVAAIALVHQATGASPRVTWVVPLKDAASAAGSPLHHAVHGRYAGFADDPAYGRGGGSPLARPSAAPVSVRVDMKAAAAALRGRIEVGLALLPTLVRAASARLPGIAPDALAARLANTARDVLEHAETLEIEVREAGDAFDLTARLAFGPGMAMPAPVPLASFREALPGELAWAFAGRVPPDLVPAGLPPAWKSLLGSMERGGLLSVDPAAPFDRFRAVVRPADARAFADAWAGGGRARASGDLVAIDAAGDEPPAEAEPGWTGDPVLWVSFRTPRKTRVDLRVFVQDRTFQCELRARR